MGVSITLVLLILVALAFDFMNGLHDAANSIATIVSTRVLKPQYAVVWAAFFNFLAFFVFGVHVANTVGSGHRRSQAGRRSADLRRADGGDLVERHHLVGRHSVIELACADRRHRRGGRGQGGLLRRHLVGPVSKTIYAIVLSPFTGFVLALLLVLFVSWAFVQGQPGLRRRLLPQVAARLGGALFAGPRQQRRAEDGGADRRAALFARHLFASSPCRAG